MSRRAISSLIPGVVFISVLTGLALQPAAASRAQAPIVLKLGHALPASHTVHQALTFMSKRLAELSGHTVDLRVFADGQLGTEPDSIEQARRGSLAAVKVSAAALEATVPDMAAFSMPYLFRNEKHYWSVLLGDIGKEILRSAESRGLHGLGYYDAGSRSFYTVSKPILKPADVQGLRLRVQASAQARDLVTILHAVPATIDYAEVFDGLQKHAIDGAENNPPSFYTSRHYELARHYSLDEHTRVPDVVLFSKTVWDGLTPQVRGWIEQAFTESLTLQRRLWSEHTAEALKQVQKAGVTIYRPDQSVFALAVGPMYTKADGTRLGELARRVMVAE